MRDSDFGDCVKANGIATSRWLSCQRPRRKLSGLMNTISLNMITPEMDWRH